MRPANRNPSVTLKNDRFLRALRRQPVDYTPVWLMRQAGRYLPEYRATRKAAGSFLAMAKNPEIACEVTLQPLRRFPLDAAILFSDILTVPDAMGLGLYFVEGEGPKFERPVRTPADIDRLAVPDMETELRYVMDAVRLIRRELDGSVPLIGFSGSPWTLACYMVEGGGSKDWGKVKALALNEPAAMHKLLDVITDAVIAYLTAQHAAGAQALQVFDTWGGTLGPAMYREFSLPYLTRIATALKALGVTSAAPIPQLPRTPPVQAQGVPDFQATGWISLLGPAHMPEAMIGELNAAANRYLALDATKALLPPLGLTPLGGTPNDLTHRMAAEIALWRPIIQAAGISID